MNPPITRPTTTTKSKSRYEMPANAHHASSHVLFCLRRGRDVPQRTTTKKDDDDDLRLDSIIVFPKSRKDKWITPPLRRTYLPPLPNLAELADTARIKITPKEEISDWEPKINAIVGWFGQLNDIDIEKEWERLERHKRVKRSWRERWACD